MKVLQQTGGRVSSLVLAVAVAACGGTARSGDSGSGADASAPDALLAVDDGGAMDAGVTPVDDGGAAADDANHGAATIGGMVNGMPFATALTSYWIGAPDDPTTTVVYVLDRAVSCTTLGSAGWDRRIPDGTQVLEMKLFGTTAIRYQVVNVMTPAPGQALVNYTLSSVSSAPVETASSMGMVTLNDLHPAVNTDGAFQLSFPAGGTLSGTFNAVFCPGGREP